MGKAKTRDAVEALTELTGEPLTFGSLLATIRETDDYTLEQMSMKLGVSSGHICDIEKGRRNVSPTRAAEWAKTLGCPVQQFVRLALQAQLDAAGIALRVHVDAA